MRKVVGLKTLLFKAKLFKWEPPAAEQLPFNHVCYPPGYRTQSATADIVHILRLVQTCRGGVPAAPPQQQPAAAHTPKKVLCGPTGTAPFVFVQNPTASLESRRAETWTLQRAGVVLISVRGTPKVCKRQREKDRKCWRGLMSAGFNAFNWIKMQNLNLTLQ